MDLTEQFDRALADGAFGTAEAIIREMDEGIRTIDRQTITHPQYPIISGRIHEAPKRLRLARYDNAVERIATKTRTLLKRSQELARSAQAGALSEKQLESFQELIQSMGSMLKEGARFKSNSEYSELYAELGARISPLKEELIGARWVHEASRSFQDLFAKHNTTLPSEVSAELEVTKDRSENFQRCVTEAQALTEKPGYLPKRKISTPLGTLDLPSLQQQCTDLHEKTIRRIKILRWQLATATLTDTIDESLKALEAANAPQEILEKNIRAVRALTSCAADIEASRELPGFDPEYTFRSHLGKHKAMDMAAVCTKVGANLQRKQPTLRWRIAKSDLEKSTKVLGQELKNATKLMKKNKKKAGRSLRALRKQLHACLDTTTLLARKSDPKWSRAKPSRSEIKSVQGIWKRCNKQMRSIKRTLAQSSKRKKK